MTRILVGVVLVCLLAAEAPHKPKPDRVAFEGEAGHLATSHKADTDALLAKRAAVVSDREAVRLKTIEALYDGILDKRPQGPAGQLVPYPATPEHWITSYGKMHPGATPDWRTDAENTGAQLTPQGVVLTNVQDDYMEWTNEAVLSDLTPFVVKIRLMAPGGAQVGIQNRGTARRCCSTSLRASGRTSSSSGTARSTPSCSTSTGSRPTSSRALPLPTG